MVPDKALVLWMELAEGRVVEFVATDVEVPLFAVERVRGVIVKPAHGLDEGSGATHRSGKVDRSLARNLRPSLVEALLVKKDHSQLLEVIFLDVTLTGCAAGQECDSEPGEGYERPHPGAWSLRLQRMV